MVEFNSKFDDDFQENFIPVSLHYWQDQHHQYTPHYRQAIVTIGQLMTSNTTIRIWNQLSPAYHSKKHEALVAVYVAQMIHSKNPYFEHDW